MPRFQLKITHYTNIQKDLNLNEHRQQRDVNIEMAETSELSDKDFKAASIIMLQHAIMNMLETNEKIKKSQQRKSLVLKLMIMHV